MSSSMPGTIMVNSSTAKRTRRPGKRYRAKAKPSIAESDTEMAVLLAVTSTLLTKYRAKSPLDQARVKLSSVGASGMSCGGISST